MLRALQRIIIRFRLRQEISNQKLHENFAKTYHCCNIKSSVRMNQFKFGNFNIMSTLYKLNTFLRHIKFNAHREVGIEWLMYTSRKEKQRIKHHQQQQ